MVAASSQVMKEFDMKVEPSVQKSFLVSVTVFLVLLIAGLWSISVFVDHERRRDLNNWQLTLGIMADSKANRILRWVDDRFAVLHELAQNGSLQLYTQQLLQKSGAEADDEPAQVSYLRNLIRATAERSGFIDQERTAPPVPANVAFQSDAALMLFDRHKKLITATPGAPEPDSHLLAMLQEAMETGPVFDDLRLNRNNQPIAGFIVPVFSLQPQGDRQEPVGFLVGFRNAAGSLFPLLAAEASSTETDEAFVVRREEEEVVYLSPLADGTLPLKRRLALNAPKLAAAYALKYPGSFVQSQDYAGTRVLMTSRKLTGLPWVLVQKIEVAEALKESKLHQRFLYSALLLVLLFVCSLLVAAWWYGSTLRERKTSCELLLKSKQLESQTQLLKAINENIFDFIFLVDADLQLIFANRVMAREVGVPAADLRGKGLANVFGPETAKKLEPFIRNALAGGALPHQGLLLELGGRACAFHTTFIPVPFQAEKNDTVLVSLHDITLLEETQKKKARLLKQVVSALMRAIDMHDPYSANHSARTTRVAMAIGGALSLPEAELATLETASGLCNLGKLIIPKELLVKTGSLTDAEQETLRQEPFFAREILEGIDFDGPVLSTIVQKNELLDGSGWPEGLAGDGVIRTARILAVANAFVAMISPRAYRDKLEADKALELLLPQADKKYDRRVVAALFHVVENEIDWADWK
jgi:PAS domain S-box-containing protein